MGSRSEGVTGHHPESASRNPLKNENVRLAILGVLFMVAVGMFGKQMFQREYIPAYGDHPEALADIEAADPRALSADDLTTLRNDAGAFAEEVANLDWRLSLLFDEGDGVFERPFKTATAATYGANNDGLGPIYNAVSCETCHFNDGRTEPLPGQGMLMRLSVPGVSAHGGPKPHPIYGGQFGDLAIDGVDAEGYLDITYEEVPGRYGDGTPYTLLKPTITPIPTISGAFDESLMTSVRAPLAMHGLGLLEAISEDTLHEWADPEDADGDGISGKINMVWDAQFKRMAPGRFGWKAETPSIITQSGDAAHNDMGVSSPYFTGQTCMEPQTDCNAAITGYDPEGDYEMSARQLDFLHAYLAFLAVPARGDLDEPTVNRGEELFHEIGCVSCHKPTAVTGDDHKFRRLRNKTIQPFTDLLLHDMGEGLSDHRTSFLSTGNEWRTAPLWGIGLLERVNGHNRLLHDGRARGFAEAILWHGGEAEDAKESFRLLSAEDRQAVINFLKSL